MIARTPPMPNFVPSCEALFMAIYVNTNVSSLQGRRYLSNVQNSLSTTYSRLSSGLRINSAKDDAAGLQIADRLTAQINGLNQGNRNTNDGIALLQTIESGMDEMSGMLQKVRTLAVQAANGTNTKEDRDAITKEAVALQEEIDRIADQTKFGGKTVLNGFQTNKSSIYDKGLAGGGPGAQQADGAPGIISFQVGANNGDAIEFQVDNFKFEKIFDRAKAAAGKTHEADFDAALDGNDKLDLSKRESAASIIKVMDYMISQVDQQRSSLGAAQNRLESSIRNQSNVAANQADARSRIRDADFAEESANLSQQSIIQQAATSMLMQANSRPQLALSMLG